MNYSEHIAELIKKDVDMYVIKDFISVLHTQNLFEVSDPFLKEPNFLTYWLKELAGRNTSPVSKMNKDFFEFLMDVCGDDVLENSSKLREDLLTHLVIDLKTNGNSAGLYDSPRFWQFISAQDVTAAEQRYNSERIMFSFFVQNKHFDFATFMLENDLAVWESKHLIEIKNVESLDFFLNTGGSLDTNVWFGNTSMTAIDYFVKMNEKNAGFMDKLNIHLQKENPEKLEEAIVKKYFETLASPIHNNGLTTILGNLKSRKDYKTISNEKGNNENTLMYAVSHNADVVNSIKSLAEKNTEFLFTHIDNQGFDVLDYIMSNSDNYESSGYNKEVKKSTVDAIKYVRDRLEKADVDTFEKRGLMWKGLQLKLKKYFNKDLELSNPSQLFNYYFNLPKVSFVDALMEKKLIDEQQLWGGSSEDWRFLNKALLCFRSENHERKGVDAGNSKSGKPYRKLSVNENFREFLETIVKFPIHNEVPSEVKENLFWIAVQENHPESARQLLDGINELHLDQKTIDFVKKNQDVYDEGVVEIVDRVLLNHDLKLKVKPVIERAPVMPEKNSIIRF